MTKLFRSLVAICWLVPFYVHAADGIAAANVKNAASTQAVPPAANQSALAADVLRAIAETPEYQKLRALYEERRNQGGDAWEKSVYGRRMASTLEALRTEAMSATTIDPDKPSGPRLVNFTQVDGQVQKFSNLVPAQVEADEAYRTGAAADLSRSIIKGLANQGLLFFPPLPPAAQEALDRGITAGKRGDYSLALQHISQANSLAVASGSFSREIYFNLGIAESKLPGRELRAVAWFGAYLTVDPYAPAPNQPAVLERMKLLHVKDKTNTGLWIKAAQEAAGKLPSEAQGAARRQVVSLWLKNGDISGAQRVAALLSKASVERSAAYGEIREAQLKVGDISGAEKTAALVQDKSLLTVARLDSAPAEAGTQRKTGSALADWLFLGNQRGLGRTIYTDLPGHLKLLDRDMFAVDDPIGYQFSSIHSIADIKIAANNHIGEMLSALAKD